VRRARISLATILVLVGVVAVLLVSSAGVFTDYLWFQEVGHIGVFLKSITSKLRTGLLGAVVMGLFLFLNLSFARKVKPEMRVVGDTIQPQVEPPIGLQALIILGTAVVSILTGLSLSSEWLVVERFLTAVPFGSVDPIFGRDVGFYIFQLPFFAMVYQFIFSTLILTIGASGAVYLFSGGLLTLGGNRLSFHPKAKVHLSVLAALVFFVRAGGYQLDIMKLVFSPRGVVFGASYTDMHAALPAYNILTVVAIIGGLVTLLTASRRSLRPVTVSVVGLVVLSFGLLQGYTTLVQQASVGPDEINKEKQYIDYNIKGTRQAFGLNNVIEKDYPAVESLSPQAVRENQDIVKNIRLWDWRPLKQTYSQLQEIRLYYSFNDVDVDRYKTNGEYRQVTLAARELNQAALPEQARTWVNLHLKFTHGYGAVVSPANAADGQGLPLFLVKDIPPKSSGDILITRPEVYFGELTKSYIIVDTRETEFDYPLGDENASSTYQGTGGVNIGSMIRRMAFGLRFRNYEILLASAINANSRLIMNRDIATRAKSIAPFLLFDEDPYLVISGGKLYWIMDAFTVTKNYPFSQPSKRGFNYMRNSVKVVIDAYQGDTTFYMFDNTDPLVKNYATIFPDLFKPYSQMPDGLKEHIRYPADLFETQAEMYSSYHMTDPTVFYNKEDLWSIPTQKASQNTPAQMESWYMIMRLPNEKSSEYMLLLPFTPSKKQNMIAWMSAQCDEPNYGKMTLYKFPKERLVYGPAQVDARIDQDADISPKLTLWNQSGSQVIRGNLLVIPIDGSILYVEPMYLQSTETKLPELKRVIVTQGNRVVMEDSIELAITSLFGAQAGPEKPGGTPATGPNSTLSVAELAAKAGSLYNQAQQAIKAGDWATYGKLIKDLGEVLSQLQNISRTK
jgi:uncharacterized protein